jgi:hypothetical protein
MAPGAFLEWGHYSAIALFSAQAELNSAVRFEFDFSSRTNSTMLFVLIFAIILLVPCFILGVRGWWHQHTFYERMRAPLSYEELQGSWEGPPDPKQAALDYNIEQMGLSAYAATIRGIMEGPGTPEEKGRPRRNFIGNCQRWPDDPIGLAVGKNKPASEPKPEGSALATRLVILRNSEPGKLGPELRACSATYETKVSANFTPGTPADYSFVA